MSGHTPGPWRVYRDGAFPAVVSGSDENDTFRYVAQDMAEADAALIAASPEMFRLLNRVSLAIDATLASGKPLDSKALVKLGAEIDAAIKRARNQ